MKLLRKAGDTSVILQVFIQDSSSVTGAGLTGLTNASAGLTAYYHRDTDTTATTISLVTMTVGTFTSSGFKEIDATNMPGWYQFCPPNTALATGAKSVGFLLKGATNMAPLPIEIQLGAGLDVEDGAALGMSRVDAAVSSRMATFTLPTNFSSLSINGSGFVTVVTNNDKTGYSLSQTFPPNFASLSIDANGNVKVQSNIKKNTALNAFEFLMTDSTNHLPKTALTVTATRSLDGAAFAACANAVAELANGIYSINLAATDLNANVVTFRFTATGADDLDVTIVTTP
ncbi:MAG: hypothetical protein KGH87_06620 [Thaumarchaeota archaeon]|nr:hypothetical protein [Nitrososphaerota archaeon]